jgi:hypothetical protein
LQPAPASPLNNLLTEATKVQPQQPLRMYADVLLLFVRILPQKIIIIAVQVPELVVATVSASQKVISLPRLVFSE